MRQFCRFDHILIISLDPAVPDIFRDRAAEKMCRLDNNRDVPTQIAFPDLPDIDPIKKDASPFDLIKTIDQIDDRGLPAPVEPTKAALEPVPA